MLGIYLLIKLVQGGDFGKNHENILGTTNGPI